MAKFLNTELVLNKDGSVYHLNLKPKHIADNVLIVGDPSRVYRISKHFDKIEFEMNKREFITHVGTYKGKRITVLSTGMGPDNIEIFFTELDALVNIDLKSRTIKSNKRKLNIIRIGTSGAIQEDIPAGSHVASEYGLGLDNLMMFYDYKHTSFEEKIAKAIKKEAKLPFKPYLAKGSSKLMDQIADGMIKGNTITSPGFYAPQGRKIRLDLKLPQLLRDLSCFHQDNFWLTNFEMETSALYAMARMLGHEMLSVNAVIANRIDGTFTKNPYPTIDSLIKKVLERL
ncbi:MAG: nucleoside phosphorylase [Bacteroidota bacterium]